MVNKGSYTLLIKLSECVEIQVGSIGNIRFNKGFYCYNGSAFGPGGLKRVERHKNKSKESEGCHWHIDYLLTLDHSEIVNIFIKENSDHECSLSKNLEERFNYKEDFGCSDCCCQSHLFFSPERKHMMSYLKDFYF